VLLTREMEERHTGVNIPQRLLEVAKKWDISDEHVSGLVRDNAAKAVLGATVTGWQHFGCAAHTLQLSVNAGLNHPIRQYLQQENLMVTLSIVSWHQQPLKKSKFNLKLNSIT